MKSYCLISGVLFAVVAVGHVLRLVNRWDLVIGAWPVPMIVSWGGAIIPAILAFWAVSLIK